MHLVVLWEPESVAAEQYRMLRRHLVNRAKKNGSRVFLITSAVHGEGKTLTSINLALSIATGLNDTVLLIDADLRKPNISNLCGLEKDTIGLAEYLAQGNDLGDYIIKTQIPKFNIIPSGKPPDNPSELISSAKMANLIKEVKNRYNNRYIILDSPPLIPIVDSTVIASLVDSVIIVIRSSATPRRWVNECINKIEDKEKIQGIIMNECSYGVLRYCSSYYKYYRDNKED
jgi:exopolysaccharide/PEP-CTERM locus tyrosine autokinase